MQNHPGLFIVLEGADGSGKTTQFRLLEQRLKAVGYEVAAFDFPRYSEPSSHFVKRYLNGDYGEATSVSPYTASLFYALDRYEASPKIKEALEGGKIVLANRYVGSNMAHQGSKFGSESEQRGFFVWAESLEFQLLGIPRPTLNIYLKVEPEVSYSLIAKKTARSYTDKKRDGHENNFEYLKRTSKTYDLLTKLFPKDFKEIEASQGGQVLGITDINDRIWEIVKPLLPPNPPNAAKSVVLNLDQWVSPTLRQSSSGSRKRSASPTLPTPAKNFEYSANNISLLSAGFLVGASEFASIDNISWNNAKTEGDCRYYVPPELPTNTKEIYTKSLDKIASLYIKMRQTADTGAAKKSKAELAQLLSAISAVVPLSAYSEVSIKTDPDAARSIVDKLQAASPRLPEIENLIKRLKEKLGSLKIQPESSLSNNDELGEPLAIEEIIKNLAESRLPQTLSDASDSLKLIEFWPRNEFDLLTDSMYPYSNLSSNEIAAELDKWTYQQKTEALTQAVSKKPENLMSEVNYRFDITTDRLKLHYMLKNRLIKDLKQQAITPRYGYEVPEIIELYGLEDMFLDCFDLSLELYSKLQSEKTEHLAGYATLLGHRVRWQFSTPALQWIAYSNDLKGNSSPHGDFFKLLREKITEVHPQLSKALFSKKASHEHHNEVAEKEAKKAKVPKKTPKKSKKKP